jgi:hypothetical protein
MLPRLLRRNPDAQSHMIAGASSHSERLATESRRTAAIVPKREGLYAAQRRSTAPNRDPWIHAAALVVIPGIGGCVNRRGARVGLW